VVKRVDAVELRVVVATVLAVAVAAVHVHDLARRRDLEAGSTRQRMGEEEQKNGAKQRKTLRLAVWHGKQKMPVVRSRVSRIEK
jgi:hypothetical protein